jgi:predicted Zn-dependent protease
MQIYNMKNLVFFLLTLTSQVMFGQIDFKPVEKAQLDSWVSSAKEKNEVNANAVPKLNEEYAMAVESNDSSNAIFDYGLSLTTVLQPGLATATENPLSDSGHQIAAEAENAYQGAINLYPKHGRANIMLGLLYNQLGKYMQSERYLEVGLQLEEGGEDWMVAANQYLLAGAYTYNTDEEKYQEVYKKFKENANQKGIKNQSYYLKMAVLYVSYYEN